MTDPNLTIKHVRRNCLDCCAGDRRYVIWCTCDGVNSSRCEFWPFRFGVQPATFRARYGDRLLTPERMPPDSVELENLPGTLEEAATGEINVEGYRQPAVAIERRPRRTLTPEQIESRVARLHAARKRSEASDAA